MTEEKKKAIQKYDKWEFGVNEYTEAPIELNRSDYVEFGKNFHI